MTHACHFPSLRSNSSHPSCVAGIFLENDTAVAFCSFSLYTNVLVPTHSEVLLINISSYHLISADRESQVSACQCFIVSLPCNHQIRCLHVSFPQRPPGCIISSSSVSRHLALRKDKQTSHAQIQVAAHNFSYLMTTDKFPDLTTTDKRMKLDLT